MNLSSRRVLWFAIGGIALWVMVLLFVTTVTMTLLFHPQPLTVRTYSVAPEVAGQMQSALSQILNAPPYGYGRVTIAPNGHLLVTARESAQADVQAIIKEVAATKLGQAADPGHRQPLREPLEGAPPLAGH